MNLQLPSLQYSEKVGFKKKINASASAPPLFMPTHAISIR